MQDNKFIVFEGVSGSGKSRGMSKFIDLLRNTHEKAGKAFRYLPLREPGGTAFGEKIRELLYIQEGESISPDTKILLIEAARIESLKYIEKIQVRFPNSWIISDRHSDSTWAYQGFGEGGSLELIEDLDFHRKGPNPIVTVFFDVPASIAMARIGAKKKEDLKYFDLREEAFFSRVVDGYRERVDYIPELYYRVDSSGSEAETDAQLQILADSLVMFGVAPPLAQEEYLEE